jgi:hypothetical protein
MESKISENQQCQSNNHCIRRQEKGHSVTGNRSQQNLIRHVKRRAHNTTITRIHNTHVLTEKRFVLLTVVFAVFSSREATRTLLLLDVADVLKSAVFLPYILCLFAGPNRLTQVYLLRHRSATLDTIQSSCPSHRPNTQIHLSLG